MPLTKTGLKVLANFVKQYGKERGKQVFYASAKEGKITPKAFAPGSKERREAQRKTHRKRKKRRK